MLRILRAFWRDEEAAAAVEHALILSTVSVAAIGAWEVLGDTVAEIVTEATSRLREIQ